MEKQAALAVTIAVLVGGVAGCATNPASLARQTSLAFGVDESKVKVSDVKTHGGLGAVAGTTYYSAEVDGKPYRCMLYHGITASTSPSCAKPGEPIKDNNPLLK